VNFVAWDGSEDPEKPMNFSRTKKLSITMITALLTFCVSFASNVFSTATFATADEFGVSAEVMILGVSLYVLGFACGECCLSICQIKRQSNKRIGPLVWGPASELYGRSRPLFLGTIFAFFNIGVALVQNVWKIMICRFLADCFGAGPIAIVGGFYVDFWSVIDRGVATAAFTGATFLGPMMGPIVGEFITKSSLG
jgi:MFS family permease